MTMTHPPQPATQRVPLCTLDELPAGLGRAFEVAGRTIAVFRTRKDEVFAMNNRCPHKNGPMSEGMIARDADGQPQAVCPLHAFRFNAATGECDQPGVCRMQTYPIRIVDGQVYIELS